MYYLHSGERKETERAEVPVQSHTICKWEGDSGFKLSSGGGVHAVQHCTGQSLPVTFYYLAI